MDVAHDATTLDAKVAIEQKANLPADYVRLIFKGRGMSDERALEDYGIAHDSMLHLVFRLGNADQQRKLLTLRCVCVLWVNSQDSTVVCIISPASYNPRRV